MGKYINQTSNGSTGTSMDLKCDALLLDGAIEMLEPYVWKEDLVCVVNNGMFAAAAYCYDEREFDAFFITKR